MTRRTGPTILAATLAAASTASSAIAPDGVTSPAGGEAPAPAEAPGARLAGLWGGLKARDLEGRAWTAGDFEGHVVLLDFWATWCAPCLADFPHLKRARAAYADRGLVVLSVSLDRGSRRDLRSFVRRQGIDWPVPFDGLGASGAVARRFRVEYPPRSLLFDRGGRLVALDARGETLEAALRALFAAD